MRLVVGGLAATPNQLPTSFPPDAAALYQRYRFQAVVSDLFSISSYGTAITTKVFPASMPRMVTEMCGFVVNAGGNGLLVGPPSRSRGFQLSLVLRHGQVLLLW